MMGLHARAGSFLALCVLTASAAATGCATLWPFGSAGQPKPCTVEWVLVADKRVNLADEGTSLPVLVRLYQTKGHDRIMNSSYDDLWMKHEEVLEDELLDVREVTVYPLERQKKRVALAPDGSHLTVAAFFREPIGGHWRHVMPVERLLQSDACADGRVSYAVRLSGSRVELLGGREKGRGAP